MKETRVDACWDDEAMMLMRFCGQMKKAVSVKHKKKGKKRRRSETRIPLCPVTTKGEHGMMLA